MISFVGVSRSFAGRPVLEELTFSVGRGQIVALRGPSGVGKTTILRLITGDLRPDAGRVAVETDNLGFVFQDPRLLPWRTALENIALAARARGADRATANATARAWIDRLGLATFADYYPAQLSGGMAQRVALARAFAVDPDLLLMDEPFSNLDLRLKGSLLGIVEEIVADRGITVLYVSHDLLEGLRLADRILELTPEHGLRELDLADRNRLLADFVSSAMGRPARLRPSAGSP